MSDPTAVMSDNLREYVFSAQPDLVSIETIELRHPDFRDGDGNVIALRVANDASGFGATLEDDAPVDGGATVAFQPGRFELVPPDSPDSGLPKATIAVENVTQLLSPYMDAGVSSNAPVEISFREYLSDDFSQPASVLHGLTLSNAKSGLIRIEADLSFDDVLNAQFHDAIYRTDVYRGLVR